MYVIHEIFNGFFGDLEKSLNKLIDGLYIILLEPTMIITNGVTSILCFEVVLSIHQILPYLFPIET
jgi:hypothetical protein